MLWQKDVINCDCLEGVLRVLENYGVPFHVVKLKKHVLVSVHFEGEYYVIHSFETPQVEIACEWVINTVDAGLIDEFIDYPEFTNTFWNSVNKDILYHVTKDKKKALEFGLNTNKKERMESHIFASTKELFGEDIIQIDVGKMKRMGVKLLVYLDFETARLHKCKTLSSAVHALYTWMSDEYNTDIVLIYDPILPIFLK